MPPRQLIPGSFEALIHQDGIKALLPQSLRQGVRIQRELDMDDCSERPPLFGQKPGRADMQLVVAWCQQREAKLPVRRARHAFHILRPSFVGENHPRFFKIMRHAGCA